MDIVAFHKRIPGWPFVRLLHQDHRTPSTNDGVKMIPDAVKEYEQAIVIRPDLPGLHLELGEIYAGRAEWPQAEEQCRAETTLHPGSAEAAFRLATRCCRKEK
jgi:hypothetical protein